MDTRIVEVKDNKHYNKYGEEVISCELCDNLTTMLGTKRCDRCWELESRIKQDLDLAKRIIRKLEQ